jgi:hypothetical protein
MRFKELNESDGVPNFADQAAGSLSKIGGLAKAAFGKLTSTYSSARQEVLRQNQANAERAVLDQDVGASTATNNITTTTPPANTRQVRNSRISDASAAIIVAKIIMSRVPDSTDLPELENLNEDDISKIQNAVNDMQVRLEAFSRKIPAFIKSSELIQANEQRDIARRLGPQNQQITDAADEILARNNNGEQTAWLAALTNNNFSIGAKAIVALLRKVGIRNAALNAADMSRPNGRVTRAEGLNLINMIGAHLHILDDRIRELQLALTSVSRSEITTEHLNNIRKLLKLL